MFVALDCRPVAKACITVPAYFNDSQRQVGTLWPCAWSLLQHPAPSQHSFIAGRACL